jgi:iron complex outermembrane receptor protein
MPDANLRRTALSLAVASACFALLHASPAMAQEIAAAAAAVPADDAGEKMTSVIVTGTRTSGLRAIDSASPVQVLDSTSLERTGQPDLIQAMAQNLPSFTAQAFGGDAAALTLSARLRGLSPNNTLVLVNGKRRHTTANLAVLGGPYQGGAAADLNFIPVAAIDHIEVLQDGAAAQYGSDAIAGVVNVILKKDTGGGTITTSGGKYIDGGGKTGDISFNTGFAPTETSFINLSLEQKYHGHSDRGNIDPRVVDPANLAAMPILRTVPGYPYVNHISGDAAYHLSIASLNAGVELTPDWSLYSVATYGKKTAEAYENYRMPNRLPRLYPLGFSPKEAIDEDDFQFTLGANCKLAGWNLDLSSTYGKDKVDISNIHSGNVSLFNDTGSTPTDFHAGQFIATQWTSNVDLSRGYDIGWATPLNVAFGYEHREDTYEIGAGDPASRYKEGSQAYPGRLASGRPEARCGRPLRKIFRLRQRQGRQADGPLRFFAGHRGTQHHQQRLPRADHGGAILLRHQRLADVRLRAAGA